MSLSLGVHVGQQNMSMNEMRTLWRKLDSSGVDWISTWDHFYEAPPKNGTEPHFEALATLGALAAETTNARIGCLVFYIGYRNPAMLAKAATTLDHITGGRFELGIGAGWHIWEATAYGYAFPDIGTRLDMLDEAAYLIRQLLTEERTTFNGKHYQTVDASCLPQPVQSHLPIWIGGVGEKRTLKIVADRADGWNAAYLPPDEFARVNQVLNHWCEEENRDPKSIKRAANIMFNLGMDEDDVKRQRKLIAADWGEMAERISGGALLCTPDRAVERIMEYRDAGADEINIALRAPWHAEALDAYLTDVMPTVRRAAH
ncbi:MAG: LLM class flavin-dependent oxidoreductase [Pseudomonadales bacterium]|jgi:alkanesulfonate monooxygenase SsuD/methylene tetrahydromethanopterin reductase-like flavin-dependent oxidoreductase (luciferase family)|nr:LLM class flavin-dependent oxidoreductase [Pseudomonadales bacterium]MDP6470454.1 LLM class flavin-dependent oxidoreductase [Pseudomonadales bacterium]MDP6827756.1 LLM class flavin-dependent oxidoreductase [Pseudomonadales bacterium]MDP6973398.1 LLM class flavin-dependent oxidoreductase [Pseudomonadales bacterium]|tara:strand:- start:92 stop:1039 length:948 start_codon:yes stop_codon:yes gene_type:complete